MTTTNTIQKEEVRCDKNKSQRTRCEVWLRTMLGYYRPLSQMNTGKKAEACSRKNFSVIKSNNLKFIEDNK
jgi:anaerobic ribonucleoside-triphosphate reductase